MLSVNYTVFSWYNFRQLSLPEEKVWCSCVWLPAVLQQLLDTDGGRGVPVHIRVGEVILYFGKEHI